jgi:hypothetical protein
MYEEASKQKAQSQPDSGADANKTDGKKEDVVDADYEVMDDDKKEKK